MAPPSANSAPAIRSVRCTRSRTRRSCAAPLARQRAQRSGDAEASDAGLVLSILMRHHCRPRWTLLCTAAHLASVAAAPMPAGMLCRSGQRHAAGAGMLDVMTAPSSSARSAYAARHLIAGLFTGLSMTATLHAQDLTRYRTHVLGAEVTEVIAALGARPDDMKTQHERPAMLQTLEWRPPYTRSDADDADPVESVTFAFVDRQLYEIAVEYDRSRIAALTTGDLVAGVAAVYGRQLVAAPYGAPRRDTGPEGTVVLARWADARATVALVRAPYGDVRLLLRSTHLGAMAAQAAGAAQAQDLVEAPARRAAAKAAAEAEQKAERIRNRSAFKP